MIKLGLIAAITISAPVAASPVPGTAMLAAAARATRIVTENGVWRCDGATCTGTADTVTGQAVAVCTALADAGGRVAAFTAAQAFGEAELARCNRHLR